MGHDKYGILIVFGTVVIGILLIFFLGTEKNLHQFTVEIVGKEAVVEDKELLYLIFGIVQSGDREGEYRTFKIADSVLNGRFRGSELYAQIEVGKVYQVTVVGFRSGILTEFENILEVEEVKTNPGRGSLFFCTNLY